MITTNIINFFTSLTLKNQFQTLDDFLKKYEEIKNKTKFEVTEISFDELHKWKFVRDRECIEHDSRKFFTIEGIRIKTNYGSAKEWDQPIINQPEIGILGIIVKKFNDILYFLMQLKMEPGNINKLQLSPTVQATKSNFSQIHKGKSTLFLEYFIDKTKSNVLIDQLQSEQGGRFLRKRNRNMIVEVKEDLNIPENFFWLTLGEIKQLMKKDNFVNMDARSVISTIPVIRNYANPHISDNDIIRWYIDKKVKYELDVKRIPLDHLINWHFDYRSIYHYYNERYFSVIAVKIDSEDHREISSWTQPIIKDKNIGLIGLITKKFEHHRHYLFQTKVMPGNIDIIDLSPTISISNYNTYKEYKPLFLDLFIEKQKNVKILYDTLQSEEGGRFYHLQNRNMIIEIQNDIEIPDDYIWLSIDQIMKFMPYGMFNIEARSLISFII